MMEIGNKRERLLSLIEVIEPRIRHYESLAGKKINMRYVGLSYMWLKVMHVKGV